MYKTILVPIDLDVEQSWSLTFDLAAGFADNWRSEIHVMTVATDQIDAGGRGFNGRSLFVDQRPVCGQTRHSNVDSGVLFSALCSHWPMCSSENHRHLASTTLLS